MSNAGKVITVNTLDDWFRTSLSNALAERRISTAADTEHYMVQLLSHYARSENLYQHSGESVQQLKPLALMLSDAMTSESAEQRHQLLQRLGDVALFIAGFFADHLARQPVDVDYYSRMGEAAYETLSSLPPVSMRTSVLKGVFVELAQKFSGLVDVLNDIAQQARIFDQRDVLRLYELWVRTGSARAAEKLQSLGVMPALGARSCLSH